MIDNVIVCIKYINPAMAGWIVTGLTTADFQRVMSWNIKAHDWQEKINWQRISASKVLLKKTISFFEW